MKNLYQRIAEVMRKVGYIKKGSTVTAGRETYTAVKGDHVISKLRAPMLDAGIIVIVSQTGPGSIFEGKTRSGTSKIRFQAMYEITYVNVDDPSDKIVISMEAHAEDMGDKAPGKAATYATKTAHLKTFSLETGDDDEQRHEPAPEMLHAAPVKLIEMSETYKKAAAALGIDVDDVMNEVRATIAAQYGGEIPATIGVLAEPLAILARAHLRGMYKAHHAKQETSGPQPEANTPEESEASAHRRKQINAEITKQGLDREEVKAGLGKLFGIPSTSGLGALTDQEWSSVISDLGMVIEAGKEEPTDGK